MNFPRQDAPWSACMTSGCSVRGSLALLESPTMSVAKLSVSHQNYLRAI